MRSHALQERAWSEERRQGCADPLVRSAVAGNNDCNGKIARISYNDQCPDLKECLHLDDVLAVVNADPKLQPGG